MDPANTVAFCLNFCFINTKIPVEYFYPFRLYSVKNFGRRFNFSPIKLDNFSQTRLLILLVYFNLLAPEFGI